MTQGSAPRRGKSWFAAAGAKASAFCSAALAAGGVMGCAFVGPEVEFAAATPFFAPFASPQQDAELYPTPTDHRPQAHIESMSERYRRSMTFSIAQGLLRMERAAPDVPFTTVDLARNFERVMFDHEAQLVAIDPSYARRPLKIRKWLDAPSYSLSGGAVRDGDHTIVAEIAAIVSANTGLDVSRARFSGPDIEIFVWDEAERAERAAELRRKGVEMARSGLSRWLTSYEMPCMGIVQTVRDVFVSAQLFIKAEVEGPMRRSCFEQEFTQAFGLTNDHDSVRPSIFNDRNEFAVLTRHDAALLRLLYDARLRPGQPRREAMPIARRILIEAPRTVWEDAPVLAAGGPRAL